MRTDEFTAVLNVTGTLHGESIPILHTQIDLACLSWTVARDTPIRPKIEHRDDCRCGQLPLPVDPRAWEAS